MRRFLGVAVAIGCGLLASTSIARKTYTIEEIESMKKAGKLTGTERFVIVRAGDSGSITGDKTEIPALVPQAAKAAEETPVIPGPKTAPERQQTAAALRRSVPADVAATIAYDKVTPTRYLVVMAREYYGNADFWPYIYEENKDILGHPDNITPGTMVRVPSLTKYGVNPKSPADADKARRLGKDIYARYGKNF